VPRFRLDLVDLIAYTEIGSKSRRFRRYRNYRGCGIFDRNRRNSCAIL